MRRPSDEEFAEFVAARWAALYRTAYLLLADHGLAEDLVQAALTKTYQHWSRIRVVDAAESYVRTTMVNEARSWWRRRSWSHERPTEFLPEQPHLDEDRWLLTELAKLTDSQRAVLVLRYYEDCSVAETARLLRLSEGTVKSQTHHALTRLREVLGDDLVDAIEPRGEQA